MAVHLNGQAVLFQRTLVDPFVLLRMNMGELTVGTDVSIMGCWASLQLQTHYRTASIEAFRHGKAHLYLQGIECELIVICIVFPIVRRLSMEAMH